MIGLRFLVAMFAPALIIAPATAQTTDLGTFGAWKAQHVVYYRGGTGCNAFTSLALQLIDGNPGSQTYMYVFIAARPNLGDLFSIQEHYQPAAQSDLFLQVDDNAPFPISHDGSNESRTIAHLPFANELLDQMLRGSALVLDGYDFNHQHYQQYFDLTGFYDALNRAHEYCKIPPLPAGYMPNNFQRPVLDIIVIAELKFAFKIFVWIAVALGALLAAGYYVILPLLRLLPEPRLAVPPNSPEPISTQPPAPRFEGSISPPSTFDDTVDLPKPPPGTPGPRGTNEDALNRSDSGPPATLDDQQTNRSFALSPTLPTIRVCTQITD